MDQIRPRERADENDRAGDDDAIAARQA